MSPFFRTAGLILGALALASPAAAATQRQIDAAVEKGTAYLKSQARDGRVMDSGHGIGPTALAGIALLDAKIPATDPVIQAIARAVREASYTETKTYQLSLCLLFLDKLEDPADVPMIQVLAVRLLAGQNAQGGWTYDCLDSIPAGDLQALRAGLKTRQLTTGKGGKEEGPDNPGKRVGKLHPDVERYAAALWARKKGGANAAIDDNSNTQFAVLGVWAARKHGVPVESALDLIEKRFIASQDPRTGGWAYNTGAAAGDSSPAMTCAGLIGLSVGVARREEHRIKAEAARKESLPPDDPKAKNPFFNPPPRPEPKKKDRPKRVADPRNIPVQRGLAGLGVMFAGQARGGGVGVADNLYFLWSLERVGVIYGVEKLGGLDWYSVGSDALVRTQKPDGSWEGNYGGPIDTCFAILFLVRSNVARDLSSKVQKDPSTTELRSGPAPGAVEPEPGPAPAPGAPATTTNATPVKPLPLPVEDESGKLAARLLLASGADWKKSLEQLRDSKGGDYTKALVLAISRLDGDRKSEAREALAERLTRMTANTLRAMAKSEDAELRRGAVLACAMKDDRAHMPDLIDRLTDDEDFVVRAAVAGLKSLSRGKDFGPPAGASKKQKQAAADAWRSWWMAQK